MKWLVMIMTFLLFEEFTYLILLYQPWCIDGVTERCNRLWVRVPHSKTNKKNCVGRDCWWLVGLHVLPHQLTGSHYREILLHDLQKLPQDVPLAVRTCMWYMRDCALAHFSCAVQDVLSSTYHDWWIGRRGLPAWPLCSNPDLNPLDFYSCRHIRALVCAVPVISEEALHHRIVDANQTIVFKECILLC
jgi:hypothetical protein